MLKLYLPPNLAAAAPRDAIAVKVQVDLSSPPAPDLLPALALLQSWCKSPAPPPFLQLTRAQLRQMVTSLAGKPVFFWIHQPTTPILWIGPVLRGVTDYLAEAPKPEGDAPMISDSRPIGSRITRGQGDSLKPAKPRPEGVGLGSLTVDGSEHFLAVTLPSREHAGYSSALELLKASGFILEPSNRKWWLRDRHKVLNFLASHRERLREEFRAEFTENFEKNTAKLQEAEVVCDAIDNGNGFNVTVALRAGKVPEDQLLAAAASNRGYVEDAGRVFLLDPKKVQKLAQAQRALAGDMAGAGITTRRTHRISTARLAEAEDVLEELAPHFQPPAAWRERSEALRDLSKLQPAPMPRAFEAILRPYQRVGVAWLWHLHRNRLGGILADEMGLGKTLQALALLCATTAARPSDAKTSLVVCPASLVENWRREAAKFAPQLKVFVHHADRRLANVSDAVGYDLVVTSYGTLARDRELFGDIELLCLIADEAQHLKNRRTQNAQTLRTLRAKGRFLLTGTPVENSLEDLRSLFEILMPGFIEKVPTGTRGDERQWFDERLRAKTAPYILRRTKQAVAPELPPKIEQVLYCELSSVQAALYRRVQEESERALLDMEAKGASEGSIRLATLTQLLRLRQVCCDPRLLLKNAAGGEGGGDGGTPSRNTDPQSAAPEREYVDSSKLETFRELLSEAVDDGHRLLVFSQFTSLLALLRQELERQEIGYCYLDGSMSARARQAEVDRFNETNEVPVFLISLKAGGTGLNLTGADTVVHFDPWWNPAVEAQATDRAHRIGQTRVVTSYKLICAGTVEEKVLQLQETKRALLADVFEASDAAAAKISLADLKALLSA